MLRRVRVSSAVRDHAAPRLGLRACLLLFGCCAVLAACGGDDEQRAPAPETPSAGSDSPPGETGETGESMWADRVNAVCRDNQRAVRKIVADVRGEGLDPREASAEVLERSIPVQRRLLQRLEELPTPEPIRSDFAGFVAGVRDALPLFEDVVAAVRADRNDPELNSKLAAIAAETRPFATRHGLLACLPDAS
jgi:hypothetical protein